MSKNRSASGPRVRARGEYTPSHVVTPIDTSTNQYHTQDKSQRNNHECAAVSEAIPPEMNTSATTILDEVRNLISVQIETFGQPASLTSSELCEFHCRTEKIRTLYSQLDRMYANDMELRLKSFSSRS